MSGIVVPLANLLCAILPCYKYRLLCFFALKTVFSNYDKIQWQVVQ